MLNANPYTYYFVLLLLLLARTCTLDWKNRHRRIVTNNNALIVGVVRTNVVEYITDMAQSEKFGALRNATGRINANQCKQELWIS